MIEQNTPSRSVEVEFKVTGEEIRGRVTALLEKFMEQSPEQATSEQITQVSTDLIVNICMLHMMMPQPMKHLFNLLSLTSEMLDEGILDSNESSEISDDSDTSESDTSDSSHSDGSDQEL